MVADLEVVLDRELIKTLYLLIAMTVFSGAIFGAIAYAIYKIIILAIKYVSLIEVV